MCEGWVADRRAAQIEQRSKNNMCVVGLQGARRALAGAAACERGTRSNRPVPPQRSRSTWWRADYAIRSGSSAMARPTDWRTHRGLEACSARSRGP